MLKVSAFALCFLAASIAQAELTIPGISTQPLNPMTTQDQTLARTGLTVNEEDITPAQDINKVQLNEQQIHEAKVWGLSLEEEKRYVLLMQNRSLIYYRGLRQTPLDILGINARNEEERNHFAALAAIQEAQKVAKNIAWNNAFAKAYNQLFVNIPIVGNFNPAPYSPYTHQPIQLIPNDTLHFFVKPTEAVKTILLVLIEAIEKTPNTHLNLYLLGSDDSSIQHWANKQQIPPQLVATGQITLNQGDLNFAALTLNKKATPLLLLSKNGHSSVVDLGRF